MGQEPEGVLVEGQALSNIDTPILASTTEPVEESGVEDQIAQNAGDSFVIGEDAIVAPDESGQIQELAVPQVERVKVFQITPMPALSDSQVADSLLVAQSADQVVARTEYENILTVQPNNTDALLGLAQIEIGEGNRESAQEIFRRLQQLNPQDPLSQAGLLEVGQATDPLSREAELKSLVQQHPDIAPLSFSLGNLFASQQRWNEAEGAYADALLVAQSSDAERVHPDYAFNLAVALERLNEQGEAYTYYREALRLSEQSNPSFDLSLLNDRIAYLGRQL